KMIYDSGFKIYELIVVHDDIDLPLGKIKIAKDSGAGGHKGVDSIINAIGAKDFIRIKIGICPEKGKPKDVEKFVIKKFTKEETDILNEAIKKSTDALDLLIREGPEKAMNQFN
ncbi:MAG: aminoacyl-tRNA hydrolase, partial [Patescibacteria group bacterium]